MSQVSYHQLEISVYFTTAVTKTTENPHNEGEVRDKLTAGECCIPPSLTHHKTNQWLKPCIYLQIFFLKNTTTTKNILLKLSSHCPVHTRGHISR